MKILSFDIGIASIGWAFVENQELIDCGVRIFTKAENPKNGDSLAAPRREARSARRRLARRKGRLKVIKRLICEEFGFNLDDYLSDDGVLPKAYQTTKDTQNPYALRTLALKQKLDSKDLARVILHIAKHRGYGNKHARDSNDNETGKVKKAIKENEKALQASQCKSVGEYLYENFYKQNKNVRNKEGNYEHCVAQEQIKDELELIFERQTEFGMYFSQGFKEEILKIAFYQRPLKDFSDKVGECIFFENEKRAAKDSISAMEFVALTCIINILKNLNHQTGEVYDKDKIQEALKIILLKGEIKYKELRKILNLAKSIRFPKDTKLDYSKREKAEDAKIIELKNLKAFKKALGENFDKLSRKELDNIATHIALTKDNVKLKEKLDIYSLSDTQKEKLGELNFAKHINLSLKALEQILPFMREGLRYDEAVKKAGLQEHKNTTQRGAFLPPIKDYEPYLANPVVARALSEYRKVCNALLRKYGKVHKIHIELTREAKLSTKERQKYEKEQRENFERNQAAKNLCRQVGLDENNAKDILKAKLFIEQGEYCVYSGKKIKLDDLTESKCIYSGKTITKNHLQVSTILQVDHIYPYSRSFDDSYMNKVLVFTQENQNKGNKTPYEAFGENKDKWGKILSRASKLPKPKYRRISNTQFTDKEKGFITRNLNDTSYIARLASQYTKDSLEFLPLSTNEITIAKEKGSKVHVEVVNGSFTAVLRHHWGFGNKDRNNHLHHAIDAVIIAYTNHNMKQEFSEYKAQRETNKASFYAKEISESVYKKRRIFFEPFKGFMQKVQEKVDKIFVSKPPRKKVRGALHKETFGFIDKADGYKVKFKSRDEKTGKIKISITDYGGEKGVQRALELGKIRQIGTKIVSNGTMVRVDIFRHKKDGKFYGVPIYTMDFALGILPNKAVMKGEDKEGVINDWLEMDSDYEFCFSLFKDDLILIQKKGMEKAELCYYTEFTTSSAGINFEKHNNLYVNLSKNECKLFTRKEKIKEGKKNAWKDKTTEEIGQLEKNRKIIGGFVTIGSLEVFEKWQVSPLGEVQKADYAPRQDITLKSSPKRKDNERDV